MSGIKPIWLKKGFIYVLGLFVLALGIALSVKADMGVSPVSSAPYVLSRITGLSLGTATIIVYLFCMALQAAILRRDYRLKNLFQIAVSFLFGYFTDPPCLSRRCSCYGQLRRPLYLPCLRHLLRGAGRSALPDRIPRRAADGRDGAGRGVQGRLQAPHGQDRKRLRLYGNRPGAVPGFSGERERTGRRHGHRRLGVGGCGRLHQASEAPLLRLSKAPKTALSLCVRGRQRPADHAGRPREYII